MTLGPNEVITRSAAPATINSTTTGTETTVSQGTINANFAGGSLSIAASDFTNARLINLASEALTTGYDDGVVNGVRGSCSYKGTIALSKLPFPAHP